MDCGARLNRLKHRKKLPMIYHEVNITKVDSSLNVQMKVDDPEETRKVEFLF